MLLLERLGQKAVGQPSILFMEVMVEMATEEEAGVRGDERQEAGFSRGVAESLNVRNGVEGRHYRSKISCSMWCSSSISLPSRARSRAPAYRRKPA